MGSTARTVSFSGAVCSGGVSVGDGKGATSVGHDKILPVLCLVVETVSGRLEPLIFILAHVVQLGGQVVQFVKVCVLAQQVIEPVHIAIVVRDEPFLIGLPEVILRADANALKDLFQFLQRGWKLHPFAHKGALVVLAQVGDEGGKEIIFVIVIMGHSDTFLSLRRRLFPMGLHLTLIGTFLPALFQPFLDGGLFLFLQVLCGELTESHFDDVGIPPLEEHQVAGYLAASILFQCEVNAVFLGGGGKGPDVLVGDLDVGNAGVVLHKLPESLLSMVQLDLVAGHSFLHLVQHFFHSLLQHPAESLVASTQRATVRCVTSSCVTYHLLSLLP